MPAEEYFRFASFEGLEERLKHLYPDEARRDKERRVTSSAWSLSWAPSSRWGSQGTFHRG